MSIFATLFFSWLQVQYAGDRMLLPFSATACVEMGSSLFGAIWKPWDGLTTLKLKCKK